MVKRKILKGKGNGAIRGLEYTIHDEVDGANDTLQNYDVICQNIYDSIVIKYWHLVQLNPIMTDQEWLHRYGSNTSRNVNLVEYFFNALSSLWRYAHTSQAIIHDKTNYYFEMTVEYPVIFMRVCNLILIIKEITMPVN